MKDGGWWVSEGCWDGGQQGLEKVEVVEESLERVRRGRESEWVRDPSIQVRWSMLQEPAAHRG